MRFEIRGSSGQAAAVFFEKEGEFVIGTQGALIAASEAVRVSRSQDSWREVLGRAVGGGSTVLVKHEGRANSFLLFGAPAGSSIRILDATATVNVVQANVLFFESTVGANFAVPADWASLWAGYGTNPASFYGKGQVGIFGRAYVDELTLENEEVFVDASHVVAWDNSLTFRIKAVSGPSILGRLVSGDALGVAFSGTGRLWLQTAKK